MELRAFGKNTRIIIKPISDDIEPKSDEPSKKKSFFSFKLNRKDQSEINNNDINRKDSNLSFKITNNSIHDISVFTATKSMQILPINTSIILNQECTNLTKDNLLKKGALEISYPAQEKVYAHITCKINANIFDDLIYHLKALGVFMENNKNCFYLNEKIDNFVKIINNMIENINNILNKHETIKDNEINFDIDTFYLQQLFLNRFKDISPNIEKSYNNIANIYLESSKGNKYDHQLRQLIKKVLDYYKECQEFKNFMHNVSNTSINE